MSLDIYTRLKTIKESNHKSIYLVRNEMNGLLYVEKNIVSCNKNLYYELLKINHPNLPYICEIIEMENKLIIIEEYVNANTLDYYLFNDELNDNNIKEIIYQLLDAVEILHKHNIIHRDIKPENIFYDGNKIKLFDFDIARIPNENQNKDTEILGSVGYAAPEQYGFKQSDERTDIYALGVLINVLYTHKLPGEQMYDGKYNGIIKKAIEIDPKNRYQNINEMRNSLTAEKLSSWAIPGFRKGLIKNKIIASLGYLFIFYWSFTGEYEDIVPGSLEEILNKILFFIVLLAIVFYSCNYRNIQAYSIFHNSRYKFLRFIGHFITILGIIMLIAIIIALFMPNS